MSKKQPDAVLALFLVEHGHQIFKAAPVRIENNEPRHYMSYDYVDFGDSYDYDNLCLFGHVHVDDERRTCRPELRYRDKYLISPSEAARMAKTMGRLTRRQQKYIDAHGYPQSLGQDLLMFAHALGARCVMKQNQPQSERMSGVRWNKMSFREAAAWADRRLHEIVRQHKQSAA